LTSDPAAIARAVKRADLTYLTTARLEGLLSAVAELKRGKVAGDLGEYGVALGGSAICIASTLDAGRRFVGYDAFGMIPAPTAADGDQVAERYRVISSGQSRGIGGETYYGYHDHLYEAVVANFARFGLQVDDARIRLVRGLYEKTLTAKARFPIAFAHIDCDWYESVRLALAHLRERLKPAGMVIVDDYGGWQGCRQATDEFLAAHGDFTMLRETPHAVLVRHSSARSASA